MVEYGTRKLGLHRPVTEVMTLEAGKLYEVKMEVQGLTDSQRTIDYLVERLGTEYPKLAITWIRVCERDQTIQIQLLPLEERLTLTGESLAIGSLLLFLPQILVLLGILVVGISVWQMLAAIPWWAWALLGTGIVLWIFGPQIGKMFRIEAEPAVMPIAYRYAY